MDLSEPVKEKELSREQKVALDKMAASEEAFLKSMQDIANNLLVNSKNFELAKQHAIMATMLFRRAISKPNEK